MTPKHHKQSKKGENELLNNFNVGPPDSVEKFHGDSTKDSTKTPLHYWCLLFVLTKPTKD